MLCSEFVVFCVCSVLLSLQNLWIVFLWYSYLQGDFRARPSVLPEEAVLLRFRVDSEALQHFGTDPSPDLPVLEF